MFLWLCSLVLLEHCWWEVPKQNILKQNMFLTTTFSDVGHIHHRSIAENCSDRVAYGNLVNPSSDCCFSGWDSLGARCTVNGVVQLYVAPAYAMTHHFHRSPLPPTNASCPRSLVATGVILQRYPAFSPPPSSFLSPSLPGSPTPIFVQNILFMFFHKQLLSLFPVLKFFSVNTCSFTYIYIHTLIELQSFDVQHFLFNVCPWQPIAVFFLELTSVDIIVSIKILLNLSPTKGVSSVFNKVCSLWQTCVPSQGDHTQQANSCFSHIYQMALQTKLW